jgi:hypothetical protein
VRLKRQPERFEKEPAKSLKRALIEERNIDG